MRSSGADGGSGPGRFPRWLAWFEPPPALPVAVADSAEAAASFRRWQRQILFSSLAGYAMFYFVRKNIGIAMPAMQADLGITKSDLGLFLTLHGVIYGLSKFANGILGDRCNARVFMVAGLVASALMNVGFGLSSTGLMLGVFWMANGWFQGMGFPPCARLMTHWFSPRELATKMSFWNTSHSIGASLVVVLCGYLVAGGWRLCFLVPAALALGSAWVLHQVLRDRPQSVGLPELPETETPGKGEAGEEPWGRFAWRAVFCNPYIWLIALANFFVYTVRYAVLDWGPTLLHEYKGIELSHAGWMVAAFEVSGIAGMLLTGWLTDRVFGSRGARMCVFCMLAAGVAVLLFWKLPVESKLGSTALLCLAGFAIYGPQALVGITVANLATKRAAATAIGLTGLFGYASTVLSGWGLGTLVEARGWDAGFAGMVALAGVGALLFAAAWPAQAHGYRLNQAK